MKIWNKKTFALGGFFLILGIVLLVTSVLKGFEIRNTILIALCLMFGLGFFTRSLSREKSKQDKLDDLDERNRLIALKSKSKSFTLTQAVSGIIMILLLGIGAARSHSQILAIGVGAAICFSASLCAELFTKIYYEKHN